MLRKFLALLMIAINCFLRVFPYPGSFSWSFEDSSPCGRGASGLGSFCTGVKPERFRVLCKGENARAGSSKAPPFLRFTDFAFGGAIFRWECWAFLVHPRENKGAKLFEKLKHRSGHLGASGNFLFSFPYVFPQMKFSSSPF